MKGYVITIMDHPGSVACAERCIASGAEHGFEMGMWPAVSRSAVDEYRRALDLPLGEWDQRYSDPEAVLSNFCTQHQIWRYAARQQEPAAIFEHDAIIDAPLPDVPIQRVLQIGRPSFGKFKTHRKPGVFTLFSKAGGYFPGAHAYIVTPEGAELLLEGAQKHGAQPVDLFLSLKHFPWLQELSPWIAHVEETFSTIQTKTGCLAKHQFREGYTYLEP